MDWEIFLQNVKLSRRGDISDPGRYLFGQILHDSLQCLNGFKSCSKLIEDSSYASQKLKDWFSRWDSIVVTWIEKLNDLWKYHKKDVPSDYVWADHILKVHQILFDVLILAKEAQILSNLIDLREEEVENIVDTAIYNIKGIRMISSNIHSKEYLLLWNLSHKQSNR